MDCEGCEYKLFEDVMAHDPLFFTRVDQFAIEVHLSKTIGASSDENVIMYGKLLALLHRSGHRLQHSVRTSAIEPSSLPMRSIQLFVHSLPLILHSPQYVLHCSYPDKPPESYGVVPILSQTRYHRTSTAFGTDGHCHNYLFARVTGGQAFTRKRRRPGTQ